MRKIILPSIRVLALPIVVSSAFAADYRGADAVLKQAAAREESARVAAPAEGKADDSAKLMRDLRGFRETSATLTPEEAAKGWLELADRFARLPREQREERIESGDLGDDEGLSFQSIVAALPPPAAWDALARAAEARPEGANSAGLRTILLRLTAHWLVHDNAAQQRDVAALEALAHKSKGPMRQYFIQPSLGLKSLLLLNSDDGEAVLKNLNDTLDLFANPEATRFSSMSAQRFEVPDLVSLAGVERAAGFLRRALRADRLQLSIPEGDETRKLARKLALEMVGELKAPQWGLAESLDATALYEALTQRFPEKQEDADDGPNFGDQRRTARIYYLLGLLAAHRPDDAAAVALKLGDKASLSLPHAALAALERAGRTRDLADFFHHLLTRNPDLPFWSEYVQLAAKTGETGKMVALAEASAARTDVTEKRRRTIRRYLRQAYLAADKVDQGIELFRQEMASADVQKPEEEQASSTMDDTGLELARLGAVLERPDLIEEGIRALRASFAANSGPRQQDAHRTALDNLAQLLIELDRGSEAETALAESLAVIPPPQSNGPSNSAARRPALIQLIALYHRAKRPADVIALLDHAPQWDAKDLAEIYKESVSTGRNQDYVGYFAAASLAAVDRRPEARKILDALLDHEGGYDPAYELMLQLEADGAAARLDALFTHDKFEERPLVWKAKVLLEQGSLEEAETTARQAIAIDPSDGEQGAGRRMRVYAVLADIREARGDRQEAATLRGAVTAIRHSEEADRFYQAGLITRAVKMYEEALTHFADAYCIQSRLALRLAETGDLAGAEEHYRRAYELMPDSFGRVESHCFGCERAFEGARAQSIAEKVFAQLAAKRPDKPQVHYLLGYLRYEQDRPREALPEFRQAVKLDSDYLNAWTKLAEVGKKMRLPAAERDAIQFNLLRLDPLGRHSSVSVTRSTSSRRS